MDLEKRRPWPANPMMIRRATFEDAAAIAAIHVRAWQAAYAQIVPPDYLAGLSESEQTGFWQLQLAVNQTIVLVAVSDGEIVGWASGGPSRDTDAKGGAEVYAIYVSPKFWRRGIGLKLMKKIEAAISPCPDITLWVLGQNQRAIEFYRKIGYEFDGTEKTICLGGVNLWEIRLGKRAKIRPDKL